MRDATLTHTCHLCGKQAEEVLAYEDGKAVRSGWLCTACWPKDGAWTKALARERVVKQEIAHD